MGFQSDGCFESLINVETVRGVNFPGPPLFTWWDPETRWGLLNPLYGLETACKELYEALKEFPEEELGVCDVDRHVSFLLGI